MKYFVRAVKYFVYYAVLTTLIVVALVLIGAVEGGIENIFEGGYEALWKIAVFFAVFAAISPKLSFMTRRLIVTESWERVRNEALNYFIERGYEIENESNDSISFRRKSLIDKALKMWEDRITLSNTEDGYMIDGRRKDLSLYTTGLECRIHPVNRED